MAVELGLPPTSSGVRVDKSIIRIGADVIELVTSGMYTSPVTIFREYVQNAADATDLARINGLLKPGEAGTVSIDFDHPNRSVTIRDNGVGISASQVPEVLLAIGGSGKRGTSARGFRGVGRLSGLAYCRELQFRTKQAGEQETTIVTWNCRGLRTQLSQTSSAEDLRDIIARCVEVRSELSESPETHFFEVVLKDISRLRQDILLNEKAVLHYLSQVASVPFSEEFSLREQIESELQVHFPNRVPLELFVSGQQAFRPYRDKLLQPGSTREIPINDVEFFSLVNVDGEVGAVGWLGHHDYVSSISSTFGVRGLRARVGDIQVGEAHLFDELYKEPRFNGWSIGEIHILDRRLVPNGRRDNFDVNHHSYNLLIQLGPIAAKISQRCRTTSVSRNSSAIILNYISDIKNVLSIPSPEPVQLSRSLANIERAYLKLKGVADENIRKELRIELDTIQEELRAKSPSDRAAVLAADAAFALIGKIITNREQANLLITELKKLGA